MITDEEISSFLKGENVEVTFTGSVDLPISKDIPGHFHVNGLDFYRLNGEFAEKYVVETIGKEIAKVKVTGQRACNDRFSAL